MDPRVIEQAGATTQLPLLDSDVSCIVATNSVTDKPRSPFLQLSATCAGSTHEATATSGPASSLHPPPPGEQCPPGEHTPSEGHAPPGTGGHTPPGGHTLPEGCTSLLPVSQSTVATEKALPTDTHLSQSSHLLPPFDGSAAPCDGPMMQLSSSSLVQLEEVNGLTHKPIARSPSLQANEVLVDDLEDEVDTMAATGHVLTEALEGCKLAPGNGHSLSDVTTDHSGSTSPYPNDDESFASFVAREANCSAPPLMDDDQSSMSRSPSPTPSQPDDDGDGMEPGPIFTTSYVTNFGLTAHSPMYPTGVPDNAPSAPLDMTLHNFPKRSKYAHRAALSAMHPYHRTRGGGASVVKTLDLLKAVLQPSLNLKIKDVCDDYLKIISSAAVNMRENTGDGVPEPTLRVLVTKMLEEALHGYQNNKWEFPYSKLPRNDKILAAKASPMATKKLKGVDPKIAAAKRNRKPPSDRDKSSGWKWGMDKRRVDPEKWEPEKLSNDTHFVLGVNVNKALGHSANRGKVYYLHPELFKYACDGDDKTWLYENKHLPVHGGKAFLMIFAEVEMLVDMDEVYRENSEVVAAVRELQHFTVPQFMLEKMKVFMVSVQGYFAQENVVLPMGLELPPLPGIVLPTDEEELTTEEKSQ